MLHFKRMDLFVRRSTEIGTERNDCAFSDNREIVGFTQHTDKIVFEICMV